MTVIYNRTYTTQCLGDLLEFINADPIITPVLQQIISDGSPISQFWFSIALLPAEIIQFDNILSTFVCPVITAISTETISLDDTSIGPNILWSSTKIYNDLLGQNELSELQDVLITSLTANDILSFNGTKWVNIPDLSNIKISLGSIINTNGSWNGFVGSNYLNSALTTTDAFTILDNSIAYNAYGYTNVITITSNYTLLLTNVVVLCNGSLTVTLPSAIGNSGKTYHIKNIGVGIVDIIPNGVETIDGANGLRISKRYTNYMLVSDGNNWSIV